MLLIPSLTVSAEPLAYWSFDDDFASLNERTTYDGIPVNGASIDHTMSRFGRGSLRLERPREQSLHIPASPFTDGSFSYAMWFFLDLDSLGANQRYFLFEASDGENWPISLGLRNLNNIPVIQVFTHDDGSHPSSTPNTAVPIGNDQRKWRHVAVGYNAKTRRHKIFLDGETIAVLPLRPDSTGVSNSSYLNIGSHRLPRGRNWHGWIDEVAIWDRTLSYREIKLLQRIPPNLLGHFRHSGYSDWIERLELYPELAIPKADPDGTGTTNLERYALVNRANEHGGQVLSITKTSIDGAKGIHIMAEKNPESRGVTYLLETSEDLEDWRKSQAERIEDIPGVLIWEEAIP